MANKVVEAMDEGKELTEINENQFNIASDVTDADKLEQQMRDQYDPNSKTAETNAPVEGEVTDATTKPQELEATTVEAEETEAQAEVEAETQAPAEQPKKVRPWSELRKTRKENKTLTEALEQERLERRRLEDRFKVIEQRLAPVQPTKETKIPEFTQDPLENLRLTAEQLAQKQAAMEQMQAVTTLQAQINADEMSYSQQHPDYTEARDWLIQQELNDAATVFSAFPEEQRNQFAVNLVNQRRAILIAAAKDAGQSVADLAYKLAHTRGYKPKATEAAATPTKPAPQVAREKVLAAKERQAVADSSIASVGASPAIKKTLTKDDIMNLSEADMDKLADAHGDDWSITQVA